MHIATDLSTQASSEPPSKRIRRSVSSPSDPSLASGQAQTPKPTDNISTVDSQTRISVEEKAPSYLSYLDLARDPVALSPTAQLAFQQHRQVAAEQRPFRHADTQARLLANHGQATPQQINTIVDTLAKPVTEHTQELAGKTATNLGVALWRSHIPAQQADAAAQALLKVADPATSDHAPLWQAEVAERLGTALWWHPPGLQLTTKKQIVDTVFQRAKGPWKSSTQQSMSMQFPALAALESSHEPAFSAHVTQASIKTLQALRREQSPSALEAGVAITSGLHNMLTKGVVPSLQLRKEALSELSDHPASTPQLREEALWKLSDHPTNTPEQAKTYRSLAMKSTYDNSPSIQSFLKGDIELLDLIKSTEQNQRLQDSFLRTFPAESLKKIASKARDLVVLASEELDRRVPQTLSLQHNLETQRRTLSGESGLHTVNLAEKGIQLNTALIQEKLSYIPYYNAFIKRVENELGLSESTSE